MHDHSHHHHHQAPLESQGRAFFWGITLNLLFVVIEVGIGWIKGSLALLTDAGHNLSDVASLVLALLAFRLARRQATTKYTYGFRKSTVLASLANAVILILAIGGLGIEAIQRISNPPEVQGLTVALVAGIGIGINGITAWMFHQGQRHDLNTRSAYLHLLADAVISAGVAVAGIAIYFTGWQWLDPAISLAVCIVILWGTWGLMRESLRLTLDGVPTAITPGEVRDAALKIEGVCGIHHIHIWAISTTENALTAHLVLEEGLKGEKINQIKSNFRHALEHLDIGHATLETETKADNCKFCDCTQVMM